MHFNIDFYISSFISSLLFKQEVSFSTYLRACILAHATLEQICTIARLTSILRLQTSNWPALLSFRALSFWYHSYFYQISVSYSCRTEALALLLASDTARVLATWASPCQQWGTSFGTLHICSASVIVLLLWQIPDIDS